MIGQRSQPGEAAIAEDSVVPRRPRQAAAGEQPCQRILAVDIPAAVPPTCAEGGGGGNSGRLGVRQEGPDKSNLHDFTPSPVTNPATVISRLMVTPLAEG